ncbi:HlyC/CorC family transporter [Candidatus Woesearchaeota archaeon]|nr:HlyC/CorC family transporter [Candidatus Woesearchaeota archaeon]
MVDIIIPHFIEAIGLIMLVFLSGLFSGTETALLSVSRFKVRHLLKKKRLGAISLHKLRENPHRMLTTLLICNNMAAVSASVLATDLALKYLSNNAIAVATGTMTFLILLFGDIIPKSLGATYSERASLIMAPLVRFLGIILFPLIMVFDFITHRIFRIRRPSHKITEEEVKTIVDMANDEGGIDKDEKELIQKIFKFDDINASEIMTPRTDMVTLEVGTKLRDALEKVKMHSRIPVHKKSKDKIVGIFYFKDAMEHIQNKRFDMPVERIMRQPFFVPETKKIDALLKVLQKKTLQMAIVVDEHGGISGLITVEDILEEIVGEIRDETEKIILDIVKTGKKSYKILGMISLEKVNRKLMTKFSAEKGYDTLSGYIMHKIGRIPEQGEEIELEDAKIRITEVSGNRIKEVILTKR